MMHREGHQAQHREIHERAAELVKREQAHRQNLDKIAEKRAELYRH
jgi:hypothetical protein